MTHPIFYALTLLVIGMGVVAASLSLILVTVWLIGKMDSLFAATKVKKKADEAVKEIPEHIHAVLVAAVATALDRPHIIHHIRMRPAGVQESWSQMGRLDIMRSHNPASTKP
ncbi:MAG TPA: OadG family protein [Thermoanaerobaculia bacterium]|nr:OadG family protein [Thermoanaerobaculia bacterium]HUM28847.1 OadG family protein [Thermoanaerobaculia bacterium]HXK67219.1 OadG family protein [Thermoanaerobaculia bacterium]